MAAALNKRNIKRLKKQITLFTKKHSNEEQKKMLEELDEEDIRAGVQEIIQRIESIHPEESVD